MNQVQAIIYRILYLNPRRACLLILFILSNTFSFFSQSFLLDSLFKNCLSKYGQVFANPSAYRLQVFYTQINRDAHGKAGFAEHSFRDGNEYIYPASTVKLPMSILALAKIEELSEKGVKRDQRMITDSAFQCRKAIVSDSSSVTGFPSIENYIKKMLLVSDNQAFARTYDFVTYNYAHKKLSESGFEAIRLLNRLEAQCPVDTLPASPPVYFFNNNTDTLYKQALSIPNHRLIHPDKNSVAGEYHRGANGKWEKGPNDFSAHNYLRPVDLHRMMKELVFDDQQGSVHLAITKDARQFLLKQLGSYPRESDHPLYSQNIYYDSYKKYLFYGASVAKINQDSIRIFNIVGRAYGFLIDCAYIIDVKNSVEFLLTCTIYVNKGGRIGSGKYEYDQLGLPFMKDLGRCIYNFERNREKEFPPDLSEYKELFDKK